MGQNIWRSAGGKGTTWEERVERCGRKYARGGISSKLKRILGGKVRYKKFGKNRKVTFARGKGNAGM